MTNNPKTVSDIVSMLDDMMGNGHGHVNISVDDTQTEDTVTTMGCLDCAKGDLACSVPTLMEGMDEELTKD